MKRNISVFWAVFLIFCLLFTGAAFADNTRFLSLGTVTAGTYLNEYQITTVDLLQSAVLAEGDELPAGLNWASRGELMFLYGTPTAAGSYSFTFIATNTEGENTELQCNLTVSPAVPSVTSGSNASCATYESVTLSVSAYTGDSGRLSYQWYCNSTGSISDGTLLSGANGSSYMPDTSAPGTTYYYCVVTNNNNGVTVSATSNPMSVNVIGVLSGKVNSDRTLYTVGETVDPSEFTLTLSYSDGTNRTVSSGFSITPSVIEKTGEQKLTFRYNGMDYTYAITADQVEELIERIEILRKPSKLSYTVGDTIDLTDLQLKVVTNLGDRTLSVTDGNNTRGIKCNVSKLTTAGTQKVTVSIEGKEAEFEVTVQEAAEVAQSIGVRSKPTKLEYAVGESFDPTGLVLKLYYTKGGTPGTRDITEGFSCSPTVFSKAGDQQVTVTYQGMTCTFRVTVKADAAATTPAPTATPVIVLTPVPVATATPTPSGNTNSGSNAASSVGLVILVLAVVVLLGVVAYLWLTRYNGLETIDRIIHRDRY